MNVMLAYLPVLRFTRYYLVLYQNARPAQTNQTPAKLCSSCHYLVGLPATSQYIHPHAAAHQPTPTPSQPSPTQPDPMYLVALELDSPPLTPAYHHREYSWYPRMTTPVDQGISTNHTSPFKQIHQHHLIPTIQCTGALLQFDFLAAENGRPHTN